ncbi:hypothetical protein HF086_007157 [Spodoptera exigua]|uniref:Laminin G domain-containing protein n=1 Tax=Spodoptera exigua TaxID=7107 RepID=A0A922MFE8_SPOEX|nr:hypothetical protein HF086_007157 [Spodoptera exigua]
MVWFNGAGYVELTRSRARPADRRQFSVAFTFRTRDENALLFMALDTANNRSVSVWLRSCRVVFVVEYGGGARLEITAAGAHCGGRPAHVQATRAFASNKLEKGSLRVNGEETLGSPAPPVQAAAALPDLAGARYWLGGAPPGHAHATPAPPLLGCVGAVTVDRAGYDLLDAPTRHGLEPRCGERTLRSAIVSGEGYIELPSPGLRRKAELGVSFSARAPSGVLLYRAPESPADQHYLALILVAGELELVAAAGKGEIRLRTNGTRFDDGRMHTVTIIRMHKQLELWVDDEQFARGALPGGAYPAQPGGLLIGLETAVSWHGAQLGRAEEGAGTVPPPPPTQHAQHDAAPACTKTSSYTVEAGAVKFGDVSHSHAWLRTRRRGDVALTLQIRTYATDGLLILAPGSKAKPKHFMCLMLREGKLRLVVRGRKRKEVSLPSSVSDGAWRQVSLKVSRGRAWLACAGASATVRGAATRAQRLYVAGLPPPPALPNLPNAITRIPGFRGCDAHAIWSSSWLLTSDGSEASTELRLQFRTSEPNGVLLAAAGLLLEVKDGAVSAERSRVSWRGAGGEAGGAAGGASGGAACDAAWHSVRARLTARALELQVDAGQVLRDAPTALLLDSSDTTTTPTPLYIGGLPEGVMESTDGGKNFNGCIRDVSIGGQQRDWTEMESIHNVLLDSCPIPQ